jgi:hypothetical protein
MKAILAIIVASLILVSTCLAVPSFNVEANSAPIIVPILSTSTFVDPTGAFHIVGEVQNVGWEYAGSTLTYSVDLTALYINSSGKIIDQQSASTSLNYVLYGAKSPFEIIESKAVIVSQMRTWGISTNLTPFSGSILQALAITQNSSYSDSAGLHIYGDIQNEGKSTSKTTEIFVTCYNLSGSVVDVGSAFSSPQDIPSGGIGSFNITITDSTQIPLIASYSLTAQSSNYALDSTSSTNLTYISPTPTVPEVPWLVIVPLLFSTFVSLTLGIGSKSRKFD